MMSNWAFHSIIVSLNNLQDATFKEVISQQTECSIALVVRGLALRKVSFYIFNNVLSVHLQLNKFSLIYQTDLL